MAEDNYWRNAPISEQAFGPIEAPGPIPIEREWTNLLRADGDMILFWGAAWRRAGGGGTTSWLVTNLSETGDVSEPHPAVSAPAPNVERILSPLAHEGRIRLMQAMADGPKGSGELTEATGIKGGNLYYHLKELIYAGYVSEQLAGYDLTFLGYQMLITVSAIANKAMADEK